MTLLDQLKSMFGENPCPAVYELEGEAGRVLRALTGVIDPEVGLDIVTMGLIRDVFIEGDRATVVMTLTTRGCPMAGALIQEIESAVEQAGLTPWVEVTFEPAWSPEHMSEAGREALASRG
jgi:metal-sulfur cluster biosynthetic enzyme